MTDSQLSHVSIITEKKKIKNKKKKIKTLKKQLQEDFEDTKGVIIIRISKKKREYNGQKKKYKRTNNDLQKIHINLKIEQHEPH